jgi:serine protease Do
MALNQTRNSVSLSLAVCLILSFCICESGFAQTATAPGDASSTVTRSVVDSRTSNNSSDAVSRLKEIEAKVRQVVKENTSACVSVSMVDPDGYGIGAGSGVVVNSSGLIFTAGHVQVPGSECTVLFADGRTARARLLGRNLNVDSGMVQIIDEGPWPYAKVGKSDDLKEGDWVVSLGHSGGFELGRKPPVRTGKLLGRKGYQLLTDAVLIGGDSGGPLFNLDGEVVGIHSSIGDSIAENRHVRIELFKRDYNRLIRGERWGQLPELADTDGGTKPPKMGVRLDLETAEVKLVQKRSPAADVGIEPGDIVRRFDGIKIESGRQLIALIREKISGDVSAIEVDRGGQILEMEIRLK